MPARLKQDSLCLQQEFWQCEEWLPYKHHIKKISPLGHKIDASLKYINYCVNTLLGAAISSLNDVAGLYDRWCGSVRHMKPQSHH